MSKACSAFSLSLLDAGLLYGNLVIEHCGNSLRKCSYVYPVDSVSTYNSRDFHYGIIGQIIDQLSVRNINRQLKLISIF